MSEDVSLSEVRSVRENADQLFDMADVDRAIAIMAAAINEKLADKNPLLLCVMKGGLFPTALLLPHLEFPLQVDYVHATRYGHATSGGSLQWRQRPPENMRDRHVLIVDDLLDEGVTLAEIVAACVDLGAAAVYTAVLVEKEKPERPGLLACDFVGLKTPDRYLFGLGMDYKTYLRNGPGLFAVADD